MTRPEDGIKQQAVTGMLWMAGGRLGTQFLDQIFTILLVRLLAPGDFGLMAMAGVFTSLLRIFSDMGLAPALVQRAKLDDDYLSTAFWGNFLFGFIICGLAVLGSGAIAQFFHQPLLQPVVAALSLRFIFAGTTATQEAILSRELKFAVLTSRNVISIVLGGLLGVILAISGAGVWSLVGQSLGVFVSRAALLWVVTSWRPRRVLSPPKFMELWAFGSRVLGSRFFGYVIKQFDNLLIGRMLGPVLLGYYAFAYGLFLVPLVDISLIVGRVAFSAFSRLQQDMARLRRAFMMTSTYISLFAFPALFGLFLVTKDFVAVLFGEAWLPAVPVLRVLLIAGLLQSHTTIWSSMIQAMGKPGWLLRWAFLSVCLYAPSFLIGIRWGIVGVATAYTASTLILIPVQFSLVQRLLGFQLKDFLSAVQPPLMAAGVMAVCVWLSQVWLTGQGVQAPARFVAAVGAGALSYTLAVLLIRRRLVIDLMHVLSETRRPQRSRLAKEGA